MEKGENKGKTSSYMIYLSQDFVSYQSALDALLGFDLKLLFSLAQFSPQAVGHICAPYQPLALGHIIQRVSKVLLMDLQMS